MSGTLTKDSDLDAISTDHRCQSADSLPDWSRSSEQVENGTPSTSPPYYDTDDDDSGPKPSELFSRFTWKIESFSQVGKKELRSNIFDVGGYKWYILIYPQGCDVANHLSLFLCVANHDKLLPGWSHFAQFTIAVVNKDPKKSKYSDTLHRFWKKEHDWGWKKFMELSKLNEGFLVDDVLIIKAQVQVIREKADRPFRCLDCQYRRELVRVYITNIDQICRRFIDDRRLKLSRLIDDEVRWSSFRAFWLSIDPTTKRRMTRERTDTILKVLVKHFFAEKEVTSTLVMDSMYSGLKLLEYQSLNKKCVLSNSNGDEVWATYPMVYIDQDFFVLADDVVTLIELAVSDTWPQQTAPAKDDKGSQNRTKEGNSGEDCSNVHHYDRDDRRLTELGRRTVEFFALIQIFSRVEVAHQEAVALRRQEELIREEEAACLAANGKRDKDKRSKKKQSKQKKGGRKGKDKGKSKEKVVVLDDTLSKQEINVAEDENPTEMTSDLSEIIDEACEVLQLDRDERESSPVNWETDASETHQIVSGCSEVVNEVNNGKGSAFIDDSSSTCSTDSASAPFKVQTTPNRGRKQLNKSQSSCETAKNGSCNTEADSMGESSNASDSSKTEQILSSVRDRILLNAQQHGKKEEMVMSHSVLKVGEPTETKLLTKPKAMDPSPVSCSIPNKKPPPVLSAQKSTSETAPRSTLSNGARTEPIAAPSPSPLKLTGTQSKGYSSISSQVGTVSRPLSAPLITVSRHSGTGTTTASIIQNAPALSRSASSLGKLANAAAYAPRSYRNAMMGTNDSVSTSSNTGSPGTSMPASLASTPSIALPGRTEKPIFNYVPVELDESHELMSESISRIDKEFDRWLTSRSSSEPPLTSTSGAVPDEFPHLDIINDLLDEDISHGLSDSEHHEPHHRLRSFSRQYSMPDYRYSNGYANGSFGTIGSGAAARRIAGNSANGSIGSTRHFSHVDLMTYSNGYVDDVMANQWYAHGDISMMDVGDTNGYSYPLEYSGMMGGANGYRHMYHPSNGY